MTNGEERPREARQTSQQFRSELKQALDIHYPGWSSRGEGTPRLSVQPETLRRWVNGKNYPNASSFHDFMEAAKKFPSEIKERLWALYHGKPIAATAAPAATEETLHLVYTVIDTFATTLVQQSNMEAIRLSLEKMTQHIERKGHLNNSVRAYLDVLGIEITRRLGNGQRLRQLAKEVEHTINKHDFDHSLLAYYHHVEGLRLCWVEGNYGLAHKHFNSSLTQYAQSGDELTRHGVICDRGMNFWCMGHLRSAMEDVQATDRYARDTKNDSLRLITQGNLALIYLAEGDLNTALLCVNDQINGAAHNPVEYARARGNRGLIRYYLRQYADALADTEADIVHYAAQEQTSGYGLAYAYAIQSLSLRALGAGEGARAAAQEALRIADSGYESIRVVALRAAAACATDDNEARALLTQALDMAEARGQRMQQAGIHLALLRLTTDAALCAQQHTRITALLTEARADAWLKRLNIGQLTELPLV